jgi:hypothetical protein
MKKSALAAIVWLAAAGAVPAAFVLLQPPKAAQTAAKSSVHRRVVGMDAPVSVDPAGFVTAAPEEPPPPPAAPVYMYGAKIKPVSPGAPPAAAPAPAAPGPATPAAAPPAPTTAPVVTPAHPPSPPGALGEAPRTVVAANHAAQPNTAPAAHGGAN